MNTETKSLESLLSAEVCAEIDRWLKKYPPEQKQSAVLTALHLAQKQNGGWLSTEMMDAVAAYLDIPKIAVYEVASFYSLYEFKPVGRHKISVCTNISCLLCGSEKIVEHLEQKLKIKMGETTADGKITLREVECLGACTGAPMFQLNDNYHEKLTVEKVNTILEQLE